MTPRYLLPAALALSLLACKPSAPDEQAAPGPDAAGQPAQPAGDSTDAPAQARLAVPPAEHWQCGDHRIATRFEGAALDAMSLMMSGRRVALRAVASEEGARFADASGNEFHSRPGAVTLSLAGQSPIPCRKSDQPSPWVDATLRGMAWRVAGNEPGWFAEVSDSDTPAIKVTLDNGARTYSVAKAPRVPADEITWAGPSDQGATVTLMIERSSCTDPMSGEEFEATGTLTVQGETWKGCAASLKD